MDRKKILIPIFVLILLAAGIWLGMKFGKEDPAGASKYSMVNTVNGEIYFGELDWFPRLVLRNAWTLQRTRGGEGQEQLTIVQASDAFWQPIEDLYLNPEHILGWTYLRNDSEVAKALANPGSFSNQLPQGSVPSGSDTFRGPTGNPPQ